MAQQIIIALLFLAAVTYLGYMVYKNFQSRSGCSSGCGSCGIDFRKVQKDLKTKDVDSGEHTGALRTITTHLNITSRLKK